MLFMAGFYLFNVVYQGEGDRGLDEIRQFFSVHWRHDLVQDRVRSRSGYSGAAFGVYRLSIYCLSARLPGERVVESGSPAES
jgi:hypothetical protein